MLSWLAEKFKGQIDLSLYRQDREARDEITRGLQDLLRRYTGAEYRKWGVG